MTEQPPSPQISPDGKFYWDGQRWLPMPGQAVTAQPTPVVVVKQPRGAWNSLVGYSCLGIAALFVVLAVAGVCSLGAHST